MSISGGRLDRSQRLGREFDRTAHPDAPLADAPFAFKLARHATDNLLKGGPTRKALEADPAFAVAFAVARERVANMQFRWVEEADPNRQCLLEIYATVVLDARYNDFINH